MLRWAHRTFQRMLDLMLESITVQRPAAIDRVSNLLKFLRILLSEKERSVALLPSLGRRSKSVVLRMREDLIGRLERRLW